MRVHSSFILWVVCECHHAAVRASQLRRLAAAAIMVASAVTIFGVWRVYGGQAAAALVAVAAALAGLTAALWRWSGAGSGRRPTVLVVGTIGVLLVSVAAVSWWLDDRGAPLPRGSGTLRILAGVSIIDDIRPILAEARQATGVTVDLTAQEGSLAATERVLSGEAATQHDAIWLPSNAYLLLHPDAPTRIVAPGTSIGTSPLILGLRRPVAARLGWDRSRPTWPDIAAAVRRREFTYGMTKPYVSNSGYSALAAVAGALAASGKPTLSRADIEANVTVLRAFFQGQSLTSGSTGELTKLFKSRTEAGRPVDGLFSYEAEVLDLNGSLAEPLTLIYPADGTVVADYPLTLLAPSDQQARVNYEAIVAFLRSPAVQNELVRRTHRRPVVGDVNLPAEIGPRDIDSLPLPGDLDAARSLLSTFEDQLRNPARTIYVLDVSGSMCWARQRPSSDDACARPGSRRIDEVKAALKALAGATTNSSFSRELTRFADREEVVLLRFSSRVSAPSTIAMSPRAEGQRQVRAAADALTPSGGTALYEALVAAYDLADRLIAEEPNRYTTIVLLSDGEANGAMDYIDFEAYFESLTGPAADVPTYAIVFGEGAREEMADVAALTHGRRFDGQTDRLDHVFAQIRGYQ